MITIGTFRLTPDGWRQAIELRKTRRESDQAFVAMWFNTDLDLPWESGFKPALETLGYHAADMWTSPSSNANIPHYGQRAYSKAHRAPA